MRPAISTATVDVEIAGSSHRYTVELLESWEGVSIRCPDLPGCVSQGDDPDEALENIRSAIQDYVEVAEEIRQRDNHLVKVA